MLPFILLSALRSAFLNAANWRWLQAKPLRDGRAHNVLRRVGLLARWSTLAILIGSVYTLLFTSVNTAYSYLLLIPIFFA